jgi:TonB-dependent receptor
VLGFRTVTNRNGRVAYVFDREINNELGNNHYDGEQNLVAGYIMPDIQITPWLRLDGGVRYEITDLTVISTARNQGTNLFTGAIDQADWLPALAITVSPATNMNLRFSYAQTVARPTFREKSSIESYDVTGNEIFVGNPALRMSAVDNVDLRWEWFRRPGELIAVGGFYKDIAGPIEKLSLDRIGQKITYTNSPDALVYGVEFEARSRLDVLASWLEPFTIGFNFAYIESEVENPPNIAAEKEAATGIDSKVRPLFDQSPYIINTDFSYDNLHTGTRASLAFYESGERLVLVNPTGYDVYEQPAPQLDFFISQDIGKHWSVKFAAKNLLDPEFRRIYGKEGQLNGEFPYSSFRKGRTFSIALTYTF